MVEFDASALVSELKREVKGAVSNKSITRAEYSTDASNYRVLPLVVIEPRDIEDILVVSQISRDQRIPLTMRGGGTSVAGNSIGTGIIVDTSVHMNRILEIDTAGQTARVQPGTVLQHLQIEAARHGLRFGPDPSTQSRATFGGSIGNNACGPHALAYGKTADNVLALDVIDGKGKRFIAERDLTVVSGLTELVNRNLGILRTEFGTFDRQVSGYSLEHLLPEKGKNLAAALVGTEGTLVTLLEATVKLVKLAPAPVLVVLGYPTMAEAADDVPNLLRHKPLAMEGMDARLIDVARARSTARDFPELPTGRGWLMIEVGGETPGDALAAAEKLANDSATNQVKILPAGDEAKALWRLRADGSGYAGRTERGRQAWPGWEDAAVPPANLGKYLREMDLLMKKYSLEGVPFGHFGDGCVHVRADFPLEQDGKVFRGFIGEATDLVLSLGGSPSGEHGDGRARSELLERMYSPQAISLFQAVKDIFDPNNLLNPGVIVKPRKLDIDLRRPSAAPILKSGGFAFGEDDGDFTNAVHRCVGIGKCRADNSASGDFMCPSFQATKNETDVTRGRSRILQELARGSFGDRAWNSPEVKESLDLCLSCKACASDCPAEVDMAKYKSEVLFRSYQNKVRPVSHYSLGWLPRWAALAKRVPRIVNTLTQAPLVRPLILTLGGMDRRRSIPKFATRGFLKGERDLEKKSGSNASLRPQIVLWVDSFSDSFAPSVPNAAKKILEQIGYEVIIPTQDACCGLTWISTGQLTGAKKRLINLLDVLGPYAEAGLQIVGLEPSCTAVLRSDLLDLLPQDPRTKKVAKATHTFAEILTRVANVEGLSWDPPDLADTTIVIQPHCHQHSVMGFRDDLEVLKSTGVSFTTLAGCCGLAGNFGMENGHYDISVAVAENALLPAIRKADSKTIFVADGFSCRTQADQLAGIKGTSLVELLASRMTV